MAKKSRKHVRQSMAAKAASGENVEIVTNLTCHDVVMGRGNKICILPGNKNFRRICWIYRDEYLSIERVHKQAVARKVLNDIASMNPPGRVLEPIQVEDGGKQKVYAVVDFDRAIEKTCQYLREKKVRPPKDYEGESAAPTTTVTTKRATRAARRQVKSKSVHDDNGDEDYSTVTEIDDSDESIKPKAVTKKKSQATKSKKTVRKGPVSVTVKVASKTTGGKFKLKATMSKTAQGHDDGEVEPKATVVPKKKAAAPNRVKIGTKGPGKTLPKKAPRNKTAAKPKLSRTPSAKTVVSSNKVMRAPPVLSSSRAFTTTTTTSPSHPGMLYRRSLRIAISNSFREEPPPTFQQQQHTETPRRIHEQEQDQVTAIKSSPCESEASAFTPLGFSADSLAAAPHTTPIRHPGNPMLDKSTPEPIETEHQHHQDSNSPIPPAPDLIHGLSGFSLPGGDNFDKELEGITAPPLTSFSSRNLSSWSNYEGFKNDDHQQHQNHHSHRHHHHHYDIKRESPQGVGDMPDPPSNLKAYNSLYFDGMTSAAGTAAISHNMFRDDEADEDHFETNK